MPKKTSRDCKLLSIKGISILNLAEISIRLYSYLLRERDLETVYAPLGIIQDKYYFIRLLGKYLPRTIICCRIGYFAIDKRRRSTTTEADCHFVAVFATMIMVIIIAISGSSMLIPLVGNELSWKLYPYINARRGRITLKGLTIEASGNEVVFKDEIICSFRHVAGHHPELFRGAGDCKSQCKHDKNKPFLHIYLRSFVATQSMSL